MNNKMNYLVILAAFFTTSLTGMITQDVSAQEPPAWSWAVPKNHPWYGKTSHDLMKTNRPVYHISGGIHENAYIFADWEGYAVMVVGPRVEYVDFDEFARQHTLVDSGWYDPKSNPDHEGWFKYENWRTGKTAKLIKWRPSPVPRNGG